jgi:hypothetical protein
MIMNQLTRRDFGKNAFMLSCLTALGLPRAAHAATAGDFLDKVKNDPFIQRDDIQYAIKSYYQTYNCTTPYPHKFNEVVTKWHLRSLQFCIDHTIEKDHVDHYVTTMAPILKRVKSRVGTKGPDAALNGMFEGTTCAYQLFEHIDVKPGERTFPCPYKYLLEQCKKYLGTFTLNWEDVCGKWCTPVWNGFAKEIGVTITIKTGETCSVKLKA